MSANLGVSAPTAVYRLFDESSNLLYVGITESLGARWKSHRREKPWWAEVASSRIAWCDTREEASKEETRVIREDRPKYNVSQSPVGRSSIAPTAAQAEALAEIDDVWAERQRVTLERERLDTLEREIIQAAWRCRIPPTEISMRVGRSASHVRKLRPDDVPPAKLGGYASPKVRKNDAGADPG